MIACNVNGASGNYQNNKSQLIFTGNHTKVEPMDVESADIKNGHAMNGQANGTADHNSREQTRYVSGLYECLSVNE